MVDGTFLQIHIQIHWLVQHVTCKQMHCRVKVGYLGKLSSALFLTAIDKQFAKYVSIVDSYNCHFVTL